MSTWADQRKPVRIIAYAAANAPALKTVNVTTVAPVRGLIRECIQLAGDQGRQVPTLMAAAGVTPNLPTIYINGYTAPN